MLDRSSHTKWLATSSQTGQPATEGPQPYHGHYSKSDEGPPYFLSANPNEKSRQADLLLQAFNPSAQNQRQTDLYEFEANLFQASQGYILRKKSLESGVSDNTLCW